MCKIVHSWVGILRTAAHPRQVAMCKIPHFHRPGMDKSCAMLHTVGMDDLREQKRRAVATMLKRSRGYSLLTQQELADKISVSRRSVAAWESGEHEPPLSVAIDWLRACNRPIDGLIDLTKCAPWELNPQPAGSDAAAEQLTLLLLAA